MRQGFLAFSAAIVFSLLTISTAWAELKNCAAFRGNGDRMAGTAYALARLTEEFGLMDAVAGASSGSVISFFYDSMILNPEVQKTIAAGEKEKAARMVALQLKSLVGYAEYFHDVYSGAALAELQGKLAKVFTQHGDPTEMNTFELLGLAQQVHDALSIDSVKYLVNPEVWELIDFKKPLSTRKNLIRLYQALVEGSNLDKIDPVVIFRTGVINVDTIVQLFGRVANFYAGRGPVDKTAWAAWFGSCSAAAKDKVWWQIEKEPLAIAGQDPTTCGEFFKKMLFAYRGQLKSMEPLADSRTEDGIGANLPALVSTSVWQGEDNVAEYEAAKARYNDFKAPDFKPNFFSGIGVGYWGNPANLSELLANPQGYTDFKTRKTVGLGSVKWRVAVKHSIAEPGFANLLKYNDDLYTAGGWMDAHSTIALRNIGCENVFYVNRKAGPSNFGLGIAMLLGMQPGPDSRGYRELFSLDPNLSPASAHAQSLAAANATVCTNWNAYAPNPGIGFARLVMNAYKAEIVQNPDLPVVENTYAKFVASYAAQDTLADGKYYGCVAPRLAD